MGRNAYRQPGTTTSIYNLPLGSPTSNVGSPTYTAGPPGTVTDPGASWITNEFVGKTVTVVSTGQSIKVASNTATVITGTGSWSGVLPTNGQNFTVGGPIYSATGVFPPLSGEILRVDQVTILMNPTDPLTLILEQDTPSSGQTSCTSTVSGGGGGTRYPAEPTAGVPINANLIVPASSKYGSQGNQGNSYNGSFAAINSATTGGVFTYCEGAQFARCGSQNTSGTPLGYATAGKLSNNGNLKGNLLTGMAGASGMSLLGGCIRIGELVPNGVIPHALQLTVSNNCLYGPQTNCTTNQCCQSQGGKANSYRWPATTADGYWCYKYSGSNPLLVMGSHVALAPSFSLASMLTQPGKILAAALQNYGAYITNTGEEFTICAEVSGSGVGTYTPNSSTDPTQGGVGDVAEEFVTVWNTLYPGVTMAQAKGATNNWAKDLKTIWSKLCVVGSNAATTTLAGQADLADYNLSVAQYPAAQIGMYGGAPLVAFAQDIGSSSSGSLLRVGATTLSTSSAIQTNTFTYSPTTGNGVLLIIGSHDSATTSQSVLTVTDSSGLNTWSNVSGATASQGHIEQEVWECPDILSTGSITISVKMNDATCGIGVTLIEVSGQYQVSASFLDVIDPANGTGTAVSIGPSSVPAAVSEFVIGAVTSANNPSNPPGGPVFSTSLTFTTTEATAGSTAVGAVCSQLVFDGTLASVAAETFSATLFNSQAWAGVILTLAPAPNSATVPDPPTGLQLTAGATQIVASYVAPANNGGDSISGYTVQYRLSSGPGPWLTFGSAGAQTSPTTITGLVNGTSYDVQVAAVTAAGQGSYCLPQTTTPEAAPTSPGAPTWDVVDSGVSGSGAIFWDWNTPSAGTAPIQSYGLQVTDVTTGTPLPLVTLNGTSPYTGTNAPVTSYLSTGLVNGHGYTATVVATNGVGTGNPSATSPLYIPEPPVAPPPSPLNLGGAPYVYPLNPVPGSSVQVLMGFAPQASGYWQLGVSALGTTTRLAPSTVMTDISSYLTDQLSISRGRSRETDQYQTGSCNFTLRNETGNFNPTNTASPFYPGVIPRAPVQVLIAGQIVFSGFVDDVQPGFDKPNTATVVISCLDAFTLLASTQLAQASFPQQTSGQRIQAILQRPEVNYMPPYSLAIGDFMMQSSLQDQVTALSFAQTIATSEAGMLYVDRCGRLQFCDKNAVPAAYGLYGPNTPQIRKVGTTVPTPVTGTTSVTPAWAADMPRSAGDLLIARVQASGASAGAITGPGGGWTAFGADVVNGNLRVNAFYAIAAGGDATPAFTSASAGHMVATLEEFTGNSASPFQASSYGTATGVGPLTVTMPTGPASSEGLAITSYGNLTSANTDSATPGSGWTASGYVTGTAVLHGGGDYYLNPSASAGNAETVSFATAGGKAAVIAFFAAAASSGGPTSTWSDTGVASSGTLIPYTDVAMQSASVLLFNQVQGTRTGGVQQTANNLASQAEYQIRQLQLPQLENVDDADVLSLCGIYVARYSLPEVRFSSIAAYLPGLSTAQRQIVASMDIGTVITVERTPPGGGAVIDQLCMVEKLDWSVDTQHPWSAKLMLGLLNMAGQSYWILGESSLGTSTLLAP